MVGWEEGTDEVVHQGECGLPARPDLAVADHPNVVFGKDGGPGGTLVVVEVVTGAGLAGEGRTEAGVAVHGAGGGAAFR